MATSFEDRLSLGPVLSDGAMGTQLYVQGGYDFNRSLDSLNVIGAGFVKAVHLDYISAGAEIITTNTFGASAPRLGAWGLADQFEEINRAGVRIAQEARRLSGQQVWIAGSMGPLGRQADLFGATAMSNAATAFRDQAKVLAEAGVDFILLETFLSIAEASEAILGIREATDLPIVAQMTFTEEGRTPIGDTPVEVAKAMGDAGVLAFGANCSVGPGPLVDVIEAMMPTATIPVIIQPNAGFAAYQQGRLVYGTSPSYMADMARRMVEAGATVVGGCCGTTPEHTAHIRDILRTPGLVSPARTSPAPAVRTREVARPAPALGPTNLAQRLSKGEFVVTMEVSPPRGFDIGPTLDKLRGVAGHVHAFNITDSPRAQGRMSALAACSLIQSRLGVETVFHIALRHRNLLALHGDLLGAHAVGARNIFAVMGDVPTTGDYPQATAVSDITTSGLIKLINGFNRGVDINGKAMEQPTEFLVGCAVDLNSANVDRELRTLERKLDAGANFLMSQPVYDPERVERFRQRLGGFPVPLLLGVLPLRSVRHAQFLHNEVPGIQISDDVIARLEAAGDAAAQEGTLIAREMLSAVHSTVAGAYFMPAFGQYDVVAETLADLALPGLGPTGHSAA